MAVTTSMFTTFGGAQTRHERVEVVTGEEAASRILYYHIPIGCYCKIFKKDFLLRNAITFFPEVYIGDGFNINALAFQYAEKVAIGNQKIYCYRRDNADSSMAKFSIKKCEMALKAIRILEEHLLVKTPKLIKACRFAYWHTSGDMYNWMILAKARKDYPSMYYQCLNEIRCYSFKALLAPVNRKEKFRAFVDCIHPRLLAFLLEYRSWKSKLLKNRK